MSRVVDYADLFETGQLKYHTECKQWSVVLVKNTVWKDCDDHVYVCLHCDGRVLLDRAAILTKEQFNWKAA